MGAAICGIIVAADNFSNVNVIIAEIVLTQVGSFMIYYSLVGFYHVSYSQIQQRMLISEQSTTDSGREILPNWCIISNDLLYTSSLRLQLRVVLKHPITTLHHPSPWPSNSPKHMASSVLSISTDLTIRYFPPNS